MKKKKSNLLSNVYDKVKQDALYKEFGINIFGVCQHDGWMIHALGKEVIALREKLEKKMKKKKNG